MGLLKPMPDAFLPIKAEKETAVKNGMKCYIHDGIEMETQCAGPLGYCTKYGGEVDKKNLPTCKFEEME